MREKFICQSGSIKNRLKSKLTASSRRGRGFSKDTRRRKMGNASHYAILCATRDDLDFLAFCPVFDLVFASIEVDFEE